MMDCIHKHVPINPCCDCYKITNTGCNDNTCTDITGYVDYRRKITELVKQGMSLEEATREVNKRLGNVLG